MTADIELTEWSSAFPDQRKTMVDCQVRTFDVTEHALLDALYDVPREAFVDPARIALAYADLPLGSAGGGRLMLRPMVVARLIQAAQVQKTDRVLDVAGGAGYTAALLAHLSNHVTALESEAGLTAAARTALASVKIEGVNCVTGPLQAGYAAAAPYDVVIVNGAIEAVPDALRAQLKDGGRLIAISATFGAPQAVRFERIGADLGARPLFSSAAPLLPAFQKVPAFVF